MKNLPEIKTIIKPVSDSSQLEGDLWDLYAKAMRLKRNDRIDGVVDEMRRSFKLAESYYFNKICHLYSSYLHYYYCKVREDKYRGKKYRSLFEKYRKLSEIEDIARADFAELSCRLNQTKQPDSRLMADLKTFCDNNKPHLELGNPHISVYIYMLLIALGYLEKDYTKVSAYCTDAIQLFEKTKVNRAQYFYFSLIPSLMLEKKYDIAEETINKALKMVPNYGYTWSVFLQYKIQNYIYSGDYEAGFRVFMEATRRSQINKSLAEQFKIIKGYFKFLAITGHLDTKINFRIGKFLNEMPIFTADKSGNFVNIIILRFIHQLATNRDRLIDEWQAIERTANRYLKKGSREQIFMRMLVRIPRYQFNKEAVEMRSREDLKALKRKVVDVDREVVEYERLWEMILFRL